MTAYFPCRSMHAAQRFAAGDSSFIAVVLNSSVWPQQPHLPLLAYPSAVESHALAGWHAQSTQRIKPATPAAMTSASRSPLLTSLLDVSFSTPHHPTPVRAPCSFTAGESDVDCDREGCQQEGGEAACDQDH